MRRLGVEEPIAKLTSQVNHIQISEVQEPIEELTRQVNEISKAARKLAESSASLNSEASKDLETKVQKAQSTVEGLKGTAQKAQSTVEGLKGTAERLEGASKRNSELQKEQIGAEERKADAVTLTPLERRTRAWQQFFSRDTVAAIAGGLILLIFSLTMIIAMFVGVTPPDIVGNAFLVILGYFFGQAVGRATASGGSQEDAYK